MQNTINYNTVISGNMHTYGLFLAHLFPALYNSQLLYGFKMSPHHVSLALRITLLFCVVFAIHTGEEKTCHCAYLHQCINKYCIVSTFCGITFSELRTPYCWLQGYNPWV